MLHITNGDIAADLIQRSGIPGPVVPWRDALHEGPVPDGLALEELSRVRAQFIVQCGWGEFEDVLRQFQERDAALRQLKIHGDVVLWFEHDLYDQLQLIQILSELAARADLKDLYLICIGEYPGISRFYGLGMLSPAQLQDLFEKRQKVSERQLQLAVAAWSAFRSPDPQNLHRALDLDTSPLPFLAPALRRHLLEFPGVSDGLSLTERRIVEFLKVAGAKPKTIFASVQEKEEAPYLGDTVFWTALCSLEEGRGALVTSTTEENFSDRTFHLTEAGKDVLEGRADYISLNGIDRWLGGVHLQSPGPVFRWDPARKKVVQGQ